MAHTQSYKAAPGTTVGHVHLKVSDLDRSVAFYTDVMGFEVQERMEGAAFLSVDGYHHHIALNTWTSRGGKRPSAGMTGLHHVAFLYPDRRSLALAARQVIEAGVRLHGASDHGVSEAIYFADPDGNGIEIYCDRPRADWPRKADGTWAISSQALDLQGLLDLAEPVTH